MTKGERIEFIGAEFALGKTLQAIGDQLGLTRERVRQIAKQFGFKRPEVSPKPPKVRLLKGRPKKFSEIRDECTLQGLSDPYRKYLAHRKNSAQRGILFRMTFPEWWSLWKPHWAERGVRRGCKVMCRYLDAGGYVVGNVRIDSIRGNAAESGMVRKMRSVRPTRTSLERGAVRGPSISGRIKRPDEAYMDKHENEDRWQEDDLHNRMQTV